MNKNRDKGHRLEREDRLLFKSLGFDKCRTSREASKLYDNCKIDLWGIPYLWQCKDVITNIDYRDIFDEMDQLIRENFLEGSNEFTFPKVIHHKRRRNKIIKKNENLIILPFEDFKKILIKLNELQRK